LRRGSVAAGVAAAAAGALVAARKRRGGGEHVAIRYEDGASVTLSAPSAQRDALLARAAEAIAAARE
jgi:hypothetical protein